MEQRKTVDLVPLAVRASLSLSSINEAERTVELIFTTGAAVKRYNWATGDYYLEKLSMDPAHVRLDRLNTGAPLLDTHSGWSLSSILGVVEDGTARMQGKRGLATVRFSKRSEVDPVWRDVQDKVIRNVSVGYMVHRYEETPAKKDGGLPTRTAVDWEPYEISMVPMPADAGAQTRSEKPSTYPCEVLTRVQERASMDPHQPSETIAENNPLVPQEQRQDPAPTREDPPEPTPAESATRAERERVQGIRLAVTAARMPSAMLDKFITDGTPLVDAQRKIFEELQKRADPKPNQGPNADSRRLETGDDPFIHVRAGIENALLHRVNPERFALSEQGRNYRGMSMLDIARSYLNGIGVRTTAMSRMDIAGAALGLVNVRAMHSTSDFPYLLADVANKSLRADYEAAPQTFMPFVRIGSVPDFKTANRVQIGDAPALHPVGEHGEFTRGTIAEGREQVQAASYGRVFAITRTALVNDDLDAFSKVPSKFARMARNLEADLVYYQLLKNANMNDGTALFAAGHGNYAGAGDITVVNVSAGDRAMMLQTGLDAVTLLNLSPKYLLVGPSKKTKALQFVSTTLQAATQANVNPFAGQLQVIVEARLENGVTIGPSGGGSTLTASGSAYAWYLAADKNQIDIIELVFLEGQSGPVIESRVGFDVDGLEIKCREDVGAKVLDHRGLYKSDGSDAS